MALSDESISSGELAQIVQVHALARLEPRSKRGADAEDSDLHSLTSSTKARIARSVCERLLASPELEQAKDDIPIAGQTMYDGSRVGALIATTFDEVVAEFRAQNALTFLDPAAPAPTELLFDVFADRGRRPAMEDRHAAIPDVNTLYNLTGFGNQSYFGVFDGHGGVDAAKFVEAQLHHTVITHPAFQHSPKTALYEGFLETDKAYLVKADRESLNSGATGCTVFIRGRKMYVSWLGDSQVMLCRGNAVVKLMDPHKPEREDEKKRIEEAGGVVVWYGAWRVNGVLSVARAFGDRKLKQWVIGKPDINVFDLDGTEEYLVIGCDGLWDVLTPDKVITLISAWKADSANHGIKGLAKYLVTQCLEDPSSSDNISIIVVGFPPGYALTQPEEPLEPTPPPPIIADTSSTEKSEEASEPTTETATATTTTAASEP
eukprot:m.115477 g.115477  ORF g.115477 m.115477 type:complete len:433 (+) comp51918_c0_seq2:175-1473(+)